MVEHLSADIRRRRLELDSCGLQFQCNFGIAAWHSEETSIELALARAQVALCDAKRRGKRAERVGRSVPSALAQTIDHTRDPVL